MKKFIIPLLVLLTSLPVVAQSQCQAYFYTATDSTTLYMYDGSYNTDSSMINVASWNWTLNGMGMSYTYTTQNPTQLLSSLPAGVYLLCLQITTSTSCTSSYCDSVFIGTQSGCQANFYYSNNANTFYFNDASFTTGGGNIVSWNWTFSGGTPSVSTLQNPVVSYPSPNTIYYATLTIATDNGCTDTYTGSVYYYDSTNCITWVDTQIYPVTTVGGSDGAIDLTVYGGGSPYTFSWSNGASTEDIYGVPSGIYSATVYTNDSMCPPYTITASVLEPYDSSNVFVDTLYGPVIDTCFTFIPDSFYVSSITTSGNVVTVMWVFTGQGQTATIAVEYTFSAYGSQVVVISIDCDPTKSISTYMSYIYIHESVGISEVNNVIGIYPNPADDVLQISDGEKFSIIRIISLDGSLVKEVSLPGSQIVVSDIPEGVYIIQGQSAEGYSSNRLQIIR